MPARIDLIGRSFGRVTVTGDAARLASGRRAVECHCECGETFICDPRSLLSGHCKSCGCLHREIVGRKSRDNITHGMSKSVEYQAWIKIKGRCCNVKDAKYADYGGRGIKVCDAWLDDFQAFYRDMGPRPEWSSSIDRIDVNGDYDPGNCRWSDAKTQSRNKRNHRLVNFEGRNMPLSEACELAGVNYRSALYRLNRGHHWQPLPSAPSP